MIKPTTPELVTFLSAQNPNAKFLDRLKIVYRPYICPFDELLELIPPQSSVFDVGCGSGQFLLLVANYNEPKKIKGIEISSSLIVNANNLLKTYKDKCEISFEQYTGDDIPEDICNYDMITMIDVGHHIPKKAQLAFFKQLYQKMKPGAQLLYKDIDASSPLVYANKLHDMVLVQEIGNEMSESKTKEMFENLNFHVEYSSKKTLFWYAHFTLLLRK